MYADGQETHGRNGDCQVIPPQPARHHAPGDEPQDDDGEGDCGDDDNVPYDLRTSRWLRHADADILLEDGRRDCGHLASALSTADEPSENIPACSSRLHDATRHSARSLDSVVLVQRQLGRSVSWHCAGPRISTLHVCFNER